MHNDDQDTELYQIEQIKLPKFAKDNRTKSGKRKPMTLLQVQLMLIMTRKL